MVQTRGPLITRYQRRDWLAAVLGTSIGGTIRALAAPFGQKDWANPRGRAFPIEARTWLDPTKLNLLGQDKFFGAGGPDYDWPNPRGYLYPSFLRDGTQPMELALLNPSIPSPLSVDGVPAGYVFANELRTFTAGPLNRPVGQDFVTAGGTDFNWINPSLGYPYPIGNRTHTASPAVQYAPSNQYDWPLPQRPVQPISLKTATDLAAALLSPAQAPFALLEWPIPRGAKIPETGFVAIQPEPLIGRDTITAGGPDYDWTNPSLGKPYPTIIRGWLQETKLNLAGKDTITAGGPDYDWTNPSLGKPYPVFLRAFDQGPLEHPFGQDTITAGGPDYDWPNPLPPRRGSDLRTFTLSSNFNLLPNPGNPFSLSDWQNPGLGKPYPIAIRGFTRETDLNLIGQDVLTAGGPDYDWLNPRGYPYPLTIRGFLSELKVNLQGKDQLPARDREWRNPRGYLHPSSNRSWLGFPQQTTPAPFGQTNWPNPRGAGYPSHLRTITQSEYPGFFTIVLPFNMADWPNPFRYVYSNAVKTATGRFQLPPYLSGNGPLLVHTYYGRRPTYWKGRT